MNPFCIEDKSHLYILSSGSQVPDSVVKDVMNAETVGKEKREEFVQERLLKNKNFFEPIKKLKLKTMSDLKKTTKLKPTENKVIMYKEQGSLAFQLLVKAQTLNLQIDLQEVMTYQLTPVPYSLGTPDGALCKTNKAGGFVFLTKDIKDYETST